MLATICASCRSGTLPDPNDVASAGLDTPTVIMKQLADASDSLNLRKDRKEISDRQYRMLMARIARGYISEAKDTTITDKNASTWGQVFTSARDWKDAELALLHATKAEKASARSDFRKLGQWVGDTLALASAQAHLGKVHEAVTTARTVFDVPPKAKAPILTSVLYDIVPAGVRHGGDLELADLIKDSIAQHELVLVDPSTDGGRDFLLARPKHIAHAWETAALLYAAGGRKDLADQALAQSKRYESASVKL